MKKFALKYLLLLIFCKTKRVSCPMSIHLECSLWFHHKGNIRMSETKPRTQRAMPLPLARAPWTKVFSAKQAELGSPV